MVENKSEKLSYENKIILAPMVRIGTLPMRLLALDYGADIVYTEELIDFKILRSIRRENAVLKTIDYIDPTDGTVIFRTCDLEKSRLVLQIGTSDAERALKVGKIVENDVAALDVNMGCPKKFSVNGGMGAALLNDPEKAKGILKKLVEGLKIPVTCKIRVFEDEEKTFELCDILASSGISALAIHGRTSSERPQHPNRSSLISKIASRLSIPVITSGASKEIEKYSDISKIKAETGSGSIMIARAAQWNCSIFRKNGLLPIEFVIKDYLKFAVDFDNSPANTKYCVQNIIRELQETEVGKRFLACQTMQQICDVWEMGDYCRLKSLDYQKRGLLGRFQVSPCPKTPLKTPSNPQKRKFEDTELYLLRCAYIKNNYKADDELPKTRLLRWIRENRKKMPQYETWAEDKLFRSVVEVDGKKYSSTFWEKNKKWAEQGAALVCLCSLEIIDKETLRKSGNLLGGED